MISFHIWRHCLCDVITGGDYVAVIILGNGDEIIHVVMQRRWYGWDEEGIEVGALVRAEFSDWWEATNKGLEEQRSVGEQGDRKEVEEVVPILLAPRFADREASAPA